MLTHPSWQRLLARMQISIADIQIAFRAPVHAAASLDQRHHPPSQLRPSTVCVEIRTVRGDELSAEDVEAALGRAALAVLKAAEEGVFGAIEHTQGDICSAGAGGGGSSRIRGSNCGGSGPRRVAVAAAGYSLGYKRFRVGGVRAWVGGAEPDEAAGRGDHGESCAVRKDEELFLLPGGECAVQIALLFHSTVRARPAGLLVVLLPNA